MLCKVLRFNTSPPCRETQNTLNISHGQDRVCCSLLTSKMETATGWCKEINTLEFGIDLGSSPKHHPKWAQSCLVHTFYFPIHRCKETNDNPEACHVTHFLDPQLLKCIFPNVRQSCAFSRQDQTILWFCLKTWHCLAFLCSLMFFSLFPLLGIARRWFPKVAIIPVPANPNPLSASDGASKISLIVFPL